MEVIILAGGLGTRLRSEVRDLPKCMAPISGKPFLQYLLDYLEQNEFNVTKVILSVGHLRDCIIDWVREYADLYSFEFEFAIETQPMGTGGGIRLALDKCLSDNPIILNGDTFFNINLSNFKHLHEISSSIISVALKPMEEFDRYGNVEREQESDLITAFKEKAYCKKGMINGGVYAVDKRAILKWFDELPKKCSMEKDILESRVATRKISGFEYNAYFIDIGIPEDYHRAERELPSML